MRAAYLGVLSWLCLSVASAFEVPEDLAKSDLIVRVFKDEQGELAHKIWKQNPAIGKSAIRDFILLEKEKIRKRDDATISSRFVVMIVSDGHYRVTTLVERKEMVTLLSGERVKLEDFKKAFGQK